VDFTNIYWNETLSTSVMGYPEMTFSVFPNPSSGQLQIEWGEEVVDRVEILNLNGRSVCTETIHRQGFYNMNLNLPSGVYMLKMYGDESVLSQKFLIENAGIRSKRPIGILPRHFRQTPKSASSHLFFAKRSFSILGLACRSAESLILLLLMASSSLWLYRYFTITLLLTWAKANWGSMARRVNMPNKRIVLVLEIMYAFTCLL
jgi:hypothetical protein